MEIASGYKKTDVGIIPEQWKVVPLGDVLSKARLGGNYANGDEESPFPLMKMGNLGRGRFDFTKVQFIVRGTKPAEEHQLAQGDVLLNTRNTLDLVGKVAIWKDELPLAFYNSNLLRLEFDPGSICSNEYACSFLNTEGSLSKLRALATGTTSVAAIYTRDLLALPIAVPTAAEQRAIATALSDVDALIAGLEHLIAKKRDIKQATMQQLLTGQTRLPGFSGEWEVKTLGDVVEKMVGGGTPSRSNTAYWGNEIPWVTVKDFATFHPRQAQESITKIGLNNSASSLIPAGTLITSTRMALGKAVVYDVDVAINQDLKALFVRSSSSVDFLRYWFEHNAARIDDLGSGSTVKGISLTELKRLAFPVLPLPEQTAIAAVLSDMDADLSSLEARLTKTRAIKQGMMQELLTGRTRLV